jgi:SHS2 domain-containing protein
VDGSEADSIEFIDHTADIGVEVRAGTLARLFELAGDALNAILVEGRSSAPTRSERIVLEAEGADLLLVDWLSELLFRFETRDELAATTRVSIEERGSGCRLDARIEATRFDPGCQRAKVLVKAVTYHRLAVRPTPAGWLARVVFDV